MRANITVSHRFTDAPEQHPNLVLGTLHLFFWLVFHPSAWRNHVARIDPDLPANFALRDLTREQWQNPALRRLLTQVFLVLPLLATLVLVPVFWLTGIRDGGTLVHFPAIVLVMSVLLGLVVSVASGTVGGAVMGITVGLAGSLLHGTTKELLHNAAIGTSIGLAGGICSQLAHHKQAHSPARQIGGIFTGVMIAVALIFMRYGLELLGITGGLASDTAYFVARSLMVGASFGLAVGWQRGWSPGLATGVATGLLYYVVLNVTNSETTEAVRGLSSGTLFAISLTATFALPYVLITFYAGVWAGVWAGTLGSYGRHIVFASVIRNDVAAWPHLPIGFMGVILGLTVAWWRPILFYPLTAAWNLLLYQAEERRPRRRSNLLRWHSAFWHEGQFLPLYGLDDHLLLTLQQHPDDGQVAMEYLATSHQRWAVQTAQLELDARQLEQCAGVMAMRKVHHTLAPELSDSQTATLLRHFSHVSRDVDAALNQTTAYHQKQALNAIEERLDSLLRQLMRSDAPYAARFHPIAMRWRHIVADRIQELATATDVSQEIHSPYVVGMPLTEQQEVFVGRTHISAEIEHFLFDRFCPPLFLYGQRRMGKTSLLNNLGRLLPSTILPLFVDLQGPASWATDHTGFLYGIAQAMTASAERQRSIVLPPLGRKLLATDPFIHFADWLDQVEQVLESKGIEQALLALDEFEALEDALNTDRFDEGAVLGLLRHLIQHRPRLKLLLAGSHTLDEFQRWASYLINVRLVHLTYLSEGEARQLIERPIHDFVLRYRPEASQRVLDLTRGHPFLVQLLCNEIVALKNDQDPAVRRLAYPNDVEAAVTKALQHGRLYFADIYHNRVDEAGKQILSCLATQGETASLSRDALASQLPRSDQLDQALELLRRRELVEAVNGNYRFQVELVRRWFAQIAQNGSTP